jgi:hypothetical protein
VTAPVVPLRPAGDGAAAAEALAAVSRHLDRCKLAACGPTSFAPAEVRAELLTVPSRVAYTGAARLLQPSG